MQSYKDGAMVTSWLGCVALLAYFALAWSYRPGEGQFGPARPIEGKDLKAVMLVHPDCPCTEASLRLFQAALSTSGEKIDTLIVIPGTPRTSNNISLAKEIPNTRVQFLNAEEIAQRFGISTSGHLLVWRDRELLFTGGITDARGENAPGGAYSEFTNVLGSSKPSAGTPVFGCPAFDREENK